MADSNKKSAFEILNAINVNDHTEVKDTGKVKLTYLSWAWAWAEVKKAYPEANYEIVKFDGIPYAYDPNTGYMVYTKVTIEGITHEMWLPVMDGNNRAMKSEPYEVKTKYNTFTVQPATMFDVNKTIMRCLVKNLAMFGLGLYIYAGEDIPDSSDVPAEAPAPAKKAPAKRTAAKKAPVVPFDCITCQRCGKTIQPFNGNTPQQVANATMKSFGKVMCMACGKVTKEEQEAALAYDPRAEQEVDDVQLPFPIGE